LKSLGIIGLGQITYLLAKSWNRGDITARW
jgi:hypothetical protein